MLSIRITNQFKKDLDRCKKRGWNFDLLEKAVQVLEKGEKLTPKYKTHILEGEYKGFHECHILADWLLVWDYDKNKTELVLTRTGTHTDIFKKFK